MKIPDKIKKTGSIILGAFLVLYAIYAAIFKGVPFFEEPGSPFHIRGPAMIILLIGAALIAYGVLYDKFERGN